MSMIFEREGIPVSSESKQLLIVVLMLLGIGVAFLYSASAVTAEAGREGDDAWFLKRQVLWVALSMGALAAGRALPVGFWRKVSWPLFGLTLLLLGLCLVPHVGASINGARRWLRAGG